MAKKNKTLEQLQEEHAEQCACAHDLGMQVPEDLTTDFDSVEVGSTVVSNLDALIRKFRDGLDLDQGDQDQGKKDLANDDEEEQAAEAKVAPKRVRKAKPAKAKPAEATEAKTGDKTMAKTARKKVAKKTAKKANGNGASRAPRVKFDEGAKISWLSGKENPAREGSGKHARYEAVRKASGKTVKTFLANKGNPVTLKNCVAQKLCTVG